MENLVRNIPIKLIILGDPYVGKTSLVTKFMGKEFSKRYQKTFGSDISFKRFDFEDSNLQKNRITFSIWDIYGEASYDELTKQYLIGTQAIIFIYDVENFTSFENLHKWFITASQNRDLSQIPIILVGNKIDLRLSEEQLISTEKGIELFESFSKSYNLKEENSHFIETSALNGKNISKVFELLSESIIDSFYLKNTN